MTKKNSMENEKRKREDELLELIKSRFDAEPEHYIPDERELQFIEMRNKLEKQTAWSFEAFVQNYEKLKAYGLEEKLIIQLEWLIVFYLENRKEEFLSSEFYERFKHHNVLKEAFMEHERTSEIKI